MKQSNKTGGCMSIVDDLMSILNFDTAVKDIRQGRKAKIMEPKMCTKQAPYITSYGRIIQHTIISVWNNGSKSSNHHTVHINIYTPNHFYGHIHLFISQYKLLILISNFQLMGFTAPPHCFGTTFALLTCQTVVIAI